MSLIKTKQSIVYDDGVTLGQLRKYFLNNEQPEFWLKSVFAWRGIYSEVAFEPAVISTNKAIDKEIQLSLHCIDMALTDSFEGWKGGNYTYDGNTLVHFERDASMYSGDNLDKSLKAILGNKFDSIMNEIASL